MTRYPKKHKEETRQAIVTIAMAAMRREGIEGARVSDVMSEAGLTHGGFYGHFTSKDDLIAEACAAGVIAAREMLVDVATRASPNERVRACLDAYLTRDRRDAAGWTPAAHGGAVAPPPAHGTSRSSPDLA